MKQAVTFLALPLVCALAGVARADLTWEHRLSVRLGSSQAAKPIGSITMRTQWQGTDGDPNAAARQRLLFSASSKDFDRLPPLPLGVLGGMGRSNASADIIDDEWASRYFPGGPLALRTLLPEAPLLSIAGRSLGNALAAPPVKRPTGPVQVGLVTDLAADKFLTYYSAQRTTLGGPLRPTIKRLRFDPWKKIAPRLSEERPEELTRSQRARLGAEVRSLYRPFLPPALKIFFRPLNETRTLSGMETRGYRLAILANVGGRGGEYSTPPEWAQVRVEMWLAGEQDGDAIVRSFNRQSRDLRRELGGQSASMWLNELSPVLWQMMPQEIIQAAQALVPPEGAPNEFFGGTPVLMHLTFTPPPIQRMAVGETRVDLKLTGRSTSPVAASDFEAPAGYKAEPLEPLLKQLDKSLAQAQTAFDKATPKAKPKAKPKPKPGPDAAEEA